MARKCPPGTICIENITLIFLIMVVIFGVFLFNKINESQHRNQYRNQYRNQPINQPINQQPTDLASVFLDPHVIPLRDNRPFQNKSLDPRGMPINIRTQGVDAPFRQVGILTRKNGGETILPLMGRPLQTNRDKHQFYTMNDKNHMIKLPVSKNGKSCTGEYGCDDLFNGDHVYVEGYNDSFKVTIYESNTLRYIPFA